MKKITALALTSAMVLSLAACGGSSSDTKTSDDSKKASKSDVEYVQDKGTLVVGITDFEPMDYKDDNDEWIGFDKDTIRNTEITVERVKQRNINIWKQMRLLFTMRRRIT